VLPNAVTDVMLQSDVVELLPDVILDVVLQGEYVQTETVETETVKTNAVFDEIVLTRGLDRCRFSFRLCCGEA
jgi:hypothetical protein